MMQSVAKADVVITNPTHIAVALSYHSPSMNAPQLVAKGAEKMAQRIIGGGREETRRSHRGE
jgi:flagellar biosynthesis protein FlhB